ncbi:zonular occludens toxin domain-containing protein [Rubellicoccus peritrichatus]|uniref:Zonular occludens toxin domain-containing protein n=1 Tax=Rubellicoccus peritrichatus TaxID=3080537 RepID=A0AAQ3QU63_9BACT|nr:zonular occludens toxin domain-containing protein [Puniceicoccus sp. CR14]WOO39660.1 zonular occludens toxin domain-containing protein [Puniceicoccus sp. CR14]
MPDAFIEIVTGSLGAGKTYSAVEKWVLPWLLKGAHVYTNVELKWTNIKEYVADKHGLELEDQQVWFLGGPGSKDRGLDMPNIFESAGGAKDFLQVVKAGTDEVPSLLVWDEVHLDFDADEHKSVDARKKEARTFMTQARKMNVHVCFISQSELNIDVKIRRMSLFIWFCRDMQKTKIPFFGKYPFAHVLRICKDSHNETFIHTREFSTKNTKIFSLYNSKAKFASLALEQAHTVKLKKVKKGKKKMIRLALFFGTPVVLFLVLAMFAFNKLQDRHNDLSNERKVASTEQVTYSSSTPAPQNEQSSSLPAYLNEEPRRYKSMSRFNSNIRIVLDNGAIVTHSDPWFQRIDEHRRAWIGGVLFLPPEEPQPEIQRERIDDLRSMPLPDETVSSFGSN